MSDQPTNPETPETPPAQAETVAPTPVSATADAPTAMPTSGGKNPDAKSGGFYWGTGRRKRAVARVRIRPGDGKFLIRGREIDDYFFDDRHKNDIVAPLKVTSTFGKYDIMVNVNGGGQTGQAGAILLGVARALLAADSALEVALRGGNFLTRDSRKVERKKPGQPGARKRFQFSKR